MALFIRVFISLFLFSTIAHSDTMGGTSTHKYYKTRNESPARCTTDHQSMCGSMPSVFNANSSCGAETKTCGQYMGTTLSTRQCTGQTPYGSYTYQDMFESAGQFDEVTFACPAGESLVLEGCTATCKNVCQDRKNTIESLSVQCGTFQCPSGSKTVVYGGKIVCDKSPGSFSQSAVGASAIKDSCQLQAQALPDSFDINDARGLNSELGGQSQAGFCSVEYRYTGEKTTSPDTPTQEGGIGFNVSYVPRNSDGSCPATHPTPGTMNDQLICAADSGSPPGDSTKCSDGTKRPESGVCPAKGNGNGNDDEGEGEGDGEGDGGDGEGCPTGQVKNAAGVCGAPGVGGGASGNCNNGSGLCSATASSKCDTPPACAGDPLLCGSINQTWVSTCKQTEALTKISTEDAKHSNDDIVTSKAAYTAAQNTANTQANGFFSAFQSSVTSGSHTGQCIPNASLSVMGRSLVIPFAQACDFFKFLRMLVIALAYLAAAKIVFRGVS